MKLDPEKRAADTETGRQKRERKEIPDSSAHQFVLNDAGHGRERPNVPLFARVSVCILCPSRLLLPLSSCADEETGGRHKKRRA